MFSFIGFALGCTLTVIKINVYHDIHHHPELLKVKVGKDLLIIVVLAFILFIIELSGFQAIFFQLGLDHLYRAPRNT